MLFMAEKKPSIASLAFGLISIMSSTPAIYLFSLKLIRPDTLINTVIFWGYVAFAGELVGLIAGLAAIFSSKSKSPAFYLGIIGVALSLLMFLLLQ
jgi:hypothetical protein